MKVKRDTVTWMTSIRWSTYQAHQRVGNIWQWSLPLVIAVMVPIRAEVAASWEPQRAWSVVVLPLVGWCWIAILLSWGNKSGRFFCTMESQKPKVESCVGEKEEDIMQGYQGLTPEFFQKLIASSDPGVTITTIGVSWIQFLLYSIDIPPVGWYRRIDRSPPNFCIYVIVLGEQFPYG